jgi:hypothetical protein
MAKNESIRDRIWIWAHEAGVYNETSWFRNVPRKSSIGPVEAAEYMGIRNLIMVRYEGRPEPPFERRYAPFRRLDKVLWSLTGLGGATSEQERKETLELAAKEPNLAGFVMDDFFCGGVYVPSPAHWLAEASAKFPVAATFVPPAPAACDKLELTQSAWANNDYRAKDFAVDVSPGGGAWREVFKGVLPDEPAATPAVDLPGTPLAALRIRVLSTHDTQGAMSCGLKRIRLWEKGRLLDTSTWEAHASSAQAAFPPGNLLVDEADVPIPASLTPRQLADLRERLVLRGRRLPLAAVVYTEQIMPRALHHLKHVEWALLWTWRPADLKDLERNLAALEKLIPDKRILLGCYMFDFHNCRALPVELMKMQAERGLKWLKAGRIEGIIFLGTPVCDLGLEAVEWTRQWLASVGD